VASIWEAPNRPFSPPAEIGAGPRNATFIIERTVDIDGRIYIGLITSDPKLIRVQND
jgi:hypothetical protein